MFVNKGERNTSRFFSCAASWGISRKTSIWYGKAPILSYPLPHPSTFLAKISRPPPPFLSILKKSNHSCRWEEGGRVRTMVTFWFLENLLTLPILRPSSLILCYFEFFPALPCYWELHDDWILNIEKGDSMLAKWTKMWQENVQCNVFI